MGVANISLKLLKLANQKGYVILLRLKFCSAFYKIFQRWIPVHRRFKEVIKYLSYIWYIRPILE